MSGSGLPPGSPDFFCAQQIALALILTPLVFDIFASCIPRLAFQEKPPPGVEKLVLSCSSPLASAARAD
jgi:hypothetical protein